MYDAIHYTYALWVCIWPRKIYNIIHQHTHVRARMPFAHTHGIHFCIRTYFHTFAPNIYAMHVDAIGCVIEFR